MAKIHCAIKQKTDYSYDIIVEDGLLKKLPSLLKKKPIGEKYAVITDTTVAKLYGKHLVTDFKKKGLKAELLTIPVGDSQKSLKTVEKLLETMMDKGFTRGDAVIALGGGVVGDIAGFAASIFMRGIPFINMPTTLLAMADSSIGGKTGVNLENGKNLAGTFYQPIAVYIDTSTLKTLDANELTNGMSEVVKTAIIKDKRLFDYLGDNINKFTRRDPHFLNKIIIQSCKIKAAIVEKDEKENGLRMILNYGHTIGHALEKISDYKIPHGRAVAHGMKIMNEICYKKQLTNKNNYSCIKNLIDQYKLTEPNNTALFSKKNWSRIWLAIQNDKKKKNSAVRFVIVPTIGKPQIYEKITKKDLFGALAAYD